MDESTGMDFRFKAIADEKELSALERIQQSIDDVLGSLARKGVTLPQIFPVRGTVSVDKVSSLPPITIGNWAELNNAFLVLSKEISALQKATLQAFQSTNIKVPSDLSISNEIKVKNWSELIDAMEELKKGFNLLINKDKDGNTLPQEVSIMNFPPTMVPQPVTHVSLNSLRGFVKSTAVTVTTSLTPLPGTPLAFRRSLQFYNNSSSITVEIGGSTLTFGQGIPVLPQSFSPSLDAGPNMILYGRTTSGSADVRVMEVSDTDEGA